MTNADVTARDYAVVRDGVVTNVIVLGDGTRWVPPAGTTIVLLDPEFGIGDHWDESDGFSKAVDLPV
ncbi:MAG: hypothetical protein ACTHLT_20580 [Devosia sp.]